MRASRTSSTTSTIFSCSFSWRSAFAMWPGYHCTMCTCAKHERNLPCMRPCMHACMHRAMRTKCSCLHQPNATSFPSGAQLLCKAVPKASLQSVTPEASHPSVQTPPAVIGQRLVLQLLSGIDGQHLTAYCADEGGSGVHRMSLFDVLE